MKPEEFIERLAGASASTAEMKKADCSPAIIDRFVKSRTCTRRKRPLSRTPMKGSEDLVKLFNEYDLNLLSIAGLDFLGEMIETPRGLQIGKEEGQPILIAPDGEIVLEEEGAGGHRLAEIAKNGTAFLDAIIIMAKFSSDRLIEKIAFDDFAAAQAAARECAKAAGGEKYLRFYWSRLGADE